jgi:hypothetical protein
MTQMSRVQPETAAWAPATRAAFRFSFLYLGLFVLATRIFGSLVLAPGLEFRGFGPLPPMRPITVWLAESLFGLAPPFDLGAADGETAAFLVQTLWLFAAAALGAGAWSLADGRRHHRSLHSGFRLFVRLVLAAQMFEYGITKIIPNQFESPSLLALLTPAGDLSLNTLLWTTIGASPEYQVVTGVVEVLGGLLLLLPRTTLAGALLSMAALLHVFLLNMTFDIGLKVTTFHLVLLAAFLIAPDARRLAAAVFGNGDVGIRRDTPGHLARVLPLVVGVWLIGVQTWLNTGYWYALGGGAPRSELYGIWDVGTLELDGAAGPVELNDYDRRWRRVVFDQPGAVVFQRTDDSFARYGAEIDPLAGTLRLTKGESRTWTSVFLFQRASPEELTLEGEMDGHRIRLQLERLGLDTFRLLESGFRWSR